MHLHDSYRRWLLIGCLAKIGQDQHLKLSPQSHILFLEVFFDKKHRASQEIIISYPSLSKFSPLAEKGGGSWWIDTKKPYFYTLEPDTMLIL